MDVVPEGFVHFSDVQEMLRIFHDVWSRLEHSCCREALAMDPSRFRNRDRTQKLGGCKFLTVDFIVCWWCFSDHNILRYEWNAFVWICILVLLLTCVSLQALVQELNFSAYLGLPVFMIPLNGPHNANLARVLINHIHTGHHTSNVRQAHWLTDKPIN